MMKSIPGQTEPLPGRIAWPGIIQYRYWCRQTRGERLHDLPPPPDIHFHQVVHDVAAHDRLVQTGLLQDERHTGSPPRKAWTNQHDNPNKAR